MYTAKYSLKLKLSYHENIPNKIQIQYVIVYVCSTVWYQPPYYVSTKNEIQSNLKKVIFLLMWAGFFL